MWQGVGHTLWMATRITFGLLQFVFSSLALLVMLLLNRKRQGPIT